MVPSLRSDAVSRVRNMGASAVVVGNAVFGFDDYFRDLAHRITFCQANLTSARKKYPA